MSLLSKSLFLELFSHFNLVIVLPEPKQNKNQQMEQLFVVEALNKCSNKKLFKNGG